MHWLLLLNDSRLCWYYNVVVFSVVLSFVLCLGWCVACHFLKEGYIACDLSSLVWCGCNHRSFDGSNFVRFCVVVTSEFVKSWFLYQNFVSNIYVYSPQKQTKETWKRTNRQKKLCTRTDRDRFRHAPNTNQRKSYSHTYKLNSCLGSHTGTNYTYG